MALHVHDTDMELIPIDSAYIELEEKKKIALKYVGFKFFESFYFHTCLTVVFLASYSTVKKDKKEISMEINTRCLAFN